MNTPKSQQNLRQRRQHSRSFKKSRTGSPYTPTSSHAGGVANGSADSQTTARYKAHVSSTWELDRWSLVLAVVILLQIIGSPFTKVEESFHVQATHDILYHQTDLASYDHKMFPGPVPRSFVGPLILAGASSTLASILTWRMLPKLLVHYVGTTLRLFQRLYTPWFNHLNSLSLSIFFLVYFFHSKTMSGIHWMGSHRSVRYKHL